MARYEVTVRSTLCFSANPSSFEFSIAEQVSIRFEGREFVWHANTEPTEHGVLWPCVTVVTADANDWEAASHRVVDFEVILGVSRRV